MFRKKPRWSRHNSTSSDFWLLLSCCFLLPLLLASAKLVAFWYHLSAHLTSLWFCTGCVSLDTALPGDALPGATQGLAPHKGSGLDLLPQP